MNRQMRIDSIPLGTTYFSEEGFLHDEPIVTSIGIFEYAQKGGKIRRELRLPKEVFSRKSLESYAGQPVIITHDAGSIDKTNVMDEIVGTILSDGYRDGNNVRCKIVIHDIDKVKKLPYRELSLGYSLDLIEEPGEWNGIKYDAIQTNIRINHLAIVESARAGGQARLNLDGKSSGLEDRETNILKGGKVMAQSNEKFSDGLTPDELDEAVKAYKERFAEENKADAEDPVETETPVEEENHDGEESDKQGKEPEDIIEEVRSHKDEEFEDVEGAKKALERKDADIDMLLATLEKVLADLKSKKEDAADEPAEEEIVEDSADTDKAEEEAMEEDAEDVPEEENTDAEEEIEEEVEEIAEEEPVEKEDSCKQDACKKDACKNTDSADVIVAKKLAICRVGDKLHMDGLESKSIEEGKKAIINHVHPEIRLDGKSASYINAMYDLTVNDVNKEKDVTFQRKQASTVKRADSKPAVKMSMAQSARQRMIEREGGNK